MTAPPLIDVRDLAKIYGEGETRVHALRGVDLTIAQGEFVAIMGTSGSGKTTMMNILGCLDRPSRGSYRLLGEEVGKLSKGRLAEIRNRTLGFVFQSYNLLPRTTALDNVQLPLQYAGIPAPERRARSIDALQRVGLGERLSHRPNQLSGGQQQRVAIARAIVNRPRVILADEPTGNLDSRTSLEIIKVFQDLGSSGISVIYVTHEADIAAFATRVITMKDGRIVQDRRQNALVADPDSIVEEAP
jgi:putative ABC transport system ATP-binding protein